MITMIIRYLRRHLPKRGLRAMMLLMASSFILAIAVAHGQTQVSNVELLTPRTGSTVYGRNPETHVILRQAWVQGVRKARVVKDGVELEPIVVRSHQESDYLHFRLPLSPGMNSFTIVPGGHQIDLRYHPLQADLNLGSLRKDAYLFHQNDQLPKNCANCHDLQKTTAAELASFNKQVSCVTCHRNIIDKADWQHSTTVNQQCLTCHQQFVKPWRIGFPTTKTEDICFTCHTAKKIWRTQKFVHGPLNVGGCALCHNPHGDENRYQLWAEGSVALCIACHSDKENLVDKEKPLRYVHGIIHGMGCVACHDPHAGDREYMINKPINELCVGCHTRLAGVTRGHPVGGHPVAGPNERRRKGYPLNCTSCHDPHGSSKRYLLIGRTTGGQICIECHNR